LLWWIWLFLELVRYIANSVLFLMVLNKISFLLSTWNIQIPIRLSSMVQLNILFLYILQPKLSKAIPISLLLILDDEIITSSMLPPSATLRVIPTVLLNISLLDIKWPADFPWLCPVIVGLKILMPMSFSKILLLVILLLLVCSEAISIPYMPYEIILPVIVLLLEPPGVMPTPLFVQVLLAMVFHSEVL